MKQTRTIESLIAIILITLFVGACSMRWSFDSEPERFPAPTATRYQGGEAPNGGLLKPAPLATPVLLTTGELVKLSTTEQMALAVAPTRDLRDLAMRLVPDVGEIPLVVNESAPEYNVGDRIEFWAHDMEFNTDFLMTAELIHKTDVAYAWVEIDQPADEEAIIAAVDHFSEQSYPAERAFFGSEWNPGVDNDPRLHILHATGLGSGIAGYFSSSAEYSRMAIPSSNEKEMFYVNLQWLNTLSNYLQYETVLSHEFQHMVHWYRDRNEETWVNEGLSEFAQEVAGFGPTTNFVNTFARLPDTQLNTWGISSTGNEAHYGSAYLFMTYFAQRFGPELTRALVAHPANGTLGVDAVLQGMGHDLSFNHLFADWVVANYADEPDALGQEGVYGYRNFDHARPNVDTIHEEYPTVLRQTTVANYGTDYLLLEGEGDLVFHFRGNTTTQLAHLPSAQERVFWWGNRGDNLDTRLTRQFDLTELAAGTPIEMEAELWWDIEPGYDIGYVMVSRDGEKWTILPSDSTTMGEGNGAFGAGYTGAGTEWHTEHFDLTSFAGAEITVRFEYVTDDAINARGLFIKSIAIPAIDYSSDFARGADGWESEGWLLTDNQLHQDWILQLLTLEDESLASVEQIPVDSRGRVSLPVAGLGNGRSAVIAISGAVPAVTEAAPYEYWIDRQ